MFFSNEINLRGYTFKMGSEKDVPRFFFIHIYLFISVPLKSCLDSNTLS